MADTLNILLGAHGDIAIMLPHLRNEFERTGRRVPVFVAKPYAPMFEGTSYVLPVEWPGDFHDMQAALSFLQDDMPDVPVKILQFYGADRPKRMASFVHDMLYHAGALPGWQRQPLIFDRRDPQRERKLVGKHTGSKPVILVGVQGKSQPFRNARMLLDDVSRAFGRTHRILDLSTVRAQRIYDILALYERAQAIISSDTVHLHMSRAVPQLPVFALATDFPELWHGTPWQERFAYYCRYGQFRQRREELLDTLSDTLRGQARKRPVLIPRTGRGTYNPSALGGLVSFRIHPLHKWKTRIMLRENEPAGKPLLLPKKFAGMSHEDMRLFKWNGKIHGALVLAKKTGRGMPRCVMAYGRLVKLATCWKMPRPVIPLYSWNNWRGMEKNWVPFEWAGRLHFVHSMRPSQVIIEVEGREVTKEYRTRMPAWAWGEPRGGTTPIDFEGAWLRFFHSRTETEPHPSPSHRYHVGALLMEKDPPFAVLGISSRPIISGSEFCLDIHPAPRYKPNVVIPYGAQNGQNGIELFIGINDSHCAVIELNKKDLNL